MNAQIICVGTEILLGDIVNTNATEISHLLAEMGIGVYKQVVVGDNKERLKKALDDAFSSCELVILTGGLGPTYDDLTKQTVAEWFGKELYLDKKEEKRLRSFFERTGRKMTENNMQQVYLPVGCRVLTNPNGTAPGCIVSENGKTAIMMPGVPHEMKAMLHDQVFPYLQEQSNSIIKSKVLNFFGIGESALESKIRDEIELMDNPTVAPYAKTGECILRITAKGKDEKECDDLIAPVAKEIREKFGKYCYAAGYKNIEQCVVHNYSQYGMTLSVAESLTGGMVSGRIVDIPGASNMFKGSVTAYSDEVKNKVLKVKKATLKKYTAVSKETAVEMAHGIKNLMKSDIGLATTGWAGPEGDNVGLVYVAVVSDSHEFVKELHLARGREDDRETIRRGATSWALRLAIMMIDGDTRLLD